MAEIDDEFQAMLDDCHDLYGEASITITQRTPGDFNPVTQTRAQATTTATVNAMREKRASSGGSFDTKESVYRVRKSELNAASPAFVPAAGDTVTHGSDVYRIAMVDNEVNDLEYVLTCKKKATPTDGA